MKSFLVAALLLTFALTVYSDPRQWDEAGAAVRLSDPIFDVASSTNADGYTLAVWAQSTGGEPVILGQLMSPDGTPQWEPEGRLLADGDRHAAYPTVAAVEGGWVIVWFDAEYIVWCDRLDGGWCISSAVRAIKVDITGTPVWAGGRSGIELVPLFSWWEELQPYKVFPSAGGAIVTWRQTWGAPLVARGISSTGELWSEEVRVTDNLGGAVIDLASDDTGGLLAVWNRIYAGDTLVRANRILPDGEYAWGDSSGIIVVSEDSVLSGTQICADGAGGAFVKWQLQTSSSVPRIQRVNAQGEVIWDAAGVPLTSATSLDDHIVLAPSYNGGSPDGLLALISLWQEPRRVVVQKISLLGARQWGDEGSEVCADLQEPPYYTESRIISDQLGGAVCAYERQMVTGEFEHELLVQRLLPDGSSLFAAECGVTVESLNDIDIEVSSLGVAPDGIQAVWFATQYDGTRMARAQWVDLETGLLAQNVPTDVALGDMRAAHGQKAVKLANGSTAIAWIDEYQTSRLYFNILNVFGELLFEELGSPLAYDQQNNAVRSRYFNLCPDETGGFFAAFYEETDTSNDVRTVHLTGNGTFIGSPHGEVAFESAGYFTEGEPFCISDGAGGCYLGASVYDANFLLSSQTILVNSNCQPVWAEPAVRSEANHDVYHGGLALSEGGSVLTVTVVSQVYPFRRLEMQRIAADGSLMWDEVISDSINQNSAIPGVAPDGQGGVYVIVPKLSEDHNTEITRLQRLNSAGSPQWGEEGIVLQDSAWSTGELECAADVLGNLTVAWNVWVNNEYRLYAQRVSPAGQKLWSEDGLVINSHPWDIMETSLAVLSDNEIYLAWQQMRDPGNYITGREIRATHLNARGEIGDDSWWVEGGNPICSSYYQSDPSMVADGMGGVMLVWVDSRTGIDTWQASLFAQRLYDPIFTDADETPGLVTEYSLSQNYPNPFNPTTTIEFSLPHSGHTSLVVYDVTGREVTRLLDQSMTAGPHRLTFDAHSLASGIYFYSLRSADFAETRKMVLLR